MTKMSRYLHNISSILILRAKKIETVDMNVISLQLVQLLKGFPSRKASRIEYDAMSPALNITDYTFKHFKD